ncbi:putative Increased loss of mitochondrial DNA protein 1 [Seiridium cardinale]
MALISAKTILTSLSLFHLTLAFFFFTNPHSIADQALVYMLGEAMGMLTPHVSFLASNDRLQLAYTIDLDARAHPARPGPLRHPNALHARGGLADPPLGIPGAPASLHILRAHYYYFHDDTTGHEGGITQVVTSDRPTWVRRRWRLGRSEEQSLLHAGLRGDAGLVLGLGHTERGDQGLCGQKEEKKLGGQISVVKCPFPRFWVSGNGPLGQLLS